MRIKKITILIGFIAIGYCPLVVATENSFRVRLESGPVWQGANSVQIPTPGGTRFELTDLGSGPGAYLRIDTTYRFGRNAIRGLYAPLSLKVTGMLGSGVSYQGVNFAPAVSTEGVYTFNSTRLTYRYQFLTSEKFELWGGFTAKIRDAEIRVTQGNLTASRSNLGFVPLAHLLLNTQLADDIRLSFEADALAAPQGRAEDLGLLLGYRVSQASEISLGYRMVEGGSDGGGSVYNFAWLHFGVVGYTIEI